MGAKIIALNLLIVGIHKDEGTFSGIDRKGTSYEIKPAKLGIIDILKIGERVNVMIFSKEILSKTRKK
jgi:hypothetical protein